MVLGIRPRTTNALARALSLPDPNRASRAERARDARRALLYQLSFERSDAGGQGEATNGDGGGGPGAMLEVLTATGQADHGVARSSAADVADRPRGFAPISGLG